MKTRVFLALILAVILVVSSAYAMRAFIFLHSKGTGTNPQEVFTQTVESQKCPSPYTYDSGRKVCAASPSCPSGGALNTQLGKCMAENKYRCSLSNEIYDDQGECNQTCRETAACNEVSLQLSSSNNSSIHRIEGTGNQLRLYTSSGTWHSVIFPSWVTLSGYMECSCEGVMRLKSQGNQIVIARCTNSSQCTPVGPGVTMNGAFGGGEVKCEQTQVQVCNPPCSGGDGFMRYPSVVNGNELSFMRWCGGTSYKTCCGTLEFHPSVSCPLGDYPCEGDTSPGYCTREEQCSLTCQSPYAPEGDTCVANPLCPLSGTYNASTGRCEIALR